MRTSTETPNIYARSLNTWMLRLNLPNNPAYLKEISQGLERLVDQAIQDHNNGLNNDAQVQYPLDPIDLRRAMEIQAFQRVLRHLAGDKVLTDQEQELLDVELWDERPDQLWLTTELSNQVSEIKDQDLVLGSTTLEPTAWFPTEIELVYLQTGVWMTDL